MRKTRLAQATLLAPLTVPLLYFAGSLAGALADPARRGYATQNLAGGLGIIFAVAAPASYAATIVLALPMLWLLQRATPLTAARTIAVGAFVGAGVAWGLEPWLRSDLFRIPLPRWAGTLLGGAAAAAWWWLAYGARRGPV